MRHFGAPVTENTTQIASFEVEFRFFNHLGEDIFADEVGTSFTAVDVQKRRGYCAFLSLRQIGC